MPAPLRYDWRRIKTVLGSGANLAADDPEWVEPFTFYRARVNADTILNAMRVRGSWHWAIIHLSPERFVVDGGIAGTMRECKHLAESAALPFEKQTSIWELPSDRADESEPAPF